MKSKRDLFPNISFKPIEFALNTLPINMAVYKMYAKCLSFIVLYFSTP